MERLKPPSEHSADFFKFRLQLEYPGFITQLEFQKKSQLQTRHFQLAVGLYQIAGFQRLRRVFRHDQVFHAVQNGIFQAKA